MLPQNAGGLNILNLKIWNRAAICKLLWRLLHQEKDKCWIQWVHGYYIKDRVLWDLTPPRQASWMVRKIIGAAAYLRDIQYDQGRMAEKEYSIRQMYREMMGEITKQSWAKMCCQNSAPAKCVFISWLLLQDRLATCSYLQKVGVHVDDMCCLCGNEVETMDHLFFGCEFSSEVWTGVAAYAGISRRPVKWTDERPFLVTQCSTNSGKQRLYRCFISVVVYNIWKERNSRRMKGKQTTSEAVVKQCNILMAWCGHNDRKIGRLLP